MLSGPASLGSQHHQLCHRRDLQWIQNYMAPSHGPPARVLSPLSFQAKCLLLPKPRGKREHLKVVWSQLSPKPCGPNLLSKAMWSPSYSRFSRRCCNQGELPPRYIMGGSHSHLSGSKHGHSYLTYPRNQSKAIAMLNDHSWGNLQNSCCAKQLSMALLHVSYPLVQTCGGEDILYF